MAALLEKDRNRIYTELRKTLGEEATQALLSQFPAREIEEPLSEEHLDRRLAELERDLTSTLTNRMIAVVGLGVALTSVLGALIG